VVAIFVAAVGLFWLVSAFPHVDGPYPAYTIRIENHGTTDGYVGSDNTAGAVVRVVDRSCRVIATLQVHNGL
jgi:hypothetical protein